VVLSKRERIVVFSTGAVLALLALDRLAYTPLMERRAVVGTDLQAATVDLERAQNLSDNAPRMRRRWNDMVKAGLTPDTTENQSRALRALYDWSQDSGISLISLQPERVEEVPKHKELLQTRLRLSGTGSMSSVGKFLYRVQTAEIPLRVTHVDVTARPEGTDDLTINLIASTISQAPAKKPAGEAAQ
jgi:hypothetical protein